MEIEREVHKIIQKKTSHPRELTGGEELVGLFKGDIFFIGATILEMHERFELLPAYAPNEFLEKFKVVDDVTRYFSYKMPREKAAN